MAIGYFPTVDPSRYQVIYRQPSTSPTTATVAPTYRTPVAPPRGVPVATTTTVAPTTTAAPIGGKVVTTTATSGDAFVSGGAATTTANAGSGSTGTSTTPTGTTTATGTESSGGGGGGGVDSRLLDLLSGAFQQQDVQQGYAPQSVSSDAITPSGGGKTNPMAVVVLAIIVMVGMYFWTHRKRGAA